jgi:type VI protein secretion system component VasK
MISDAIVVAILSLIGTLAGSYFSNRKGQILIAYRLEQLESKVNKHNQVIERTYKLEELTAIQEEKLKVANHRIDDLEHKAG